MKSLDYCIKKHGASLNEYEVEDIRKRAQGYAHATAKGQNPDELALAEVIDELNDEITGLEGQAAAQGWVKAEKKEVPKEVKAGTEVAKAPEKEEAAPEAKGKEPWEMSYEEFAAPIKKEAYHNLGAGRSIDEFGGVRALHKMNIEAALKEGKPVPPEVLKDYPGLAQLPKKKEKVGPRPAGEVDELKEAISRIAEVPTDSLSIDAERFQFKRFVGKEGIGLTLKGIQIYKPELGGIISVWKDPEDGKTYVINGHHRYELAKRTGHKSLVVQFLDAQDAEGARTKGALINIAESQGDPEDAAVVFRKLGMTPESLEREHGISLRGKIAREGISLSFLNDSLFNQVLKGDFPRAWGVIIGEKLPDHNAQGELAKYLSKMEKKGRIINGGLIEQVINVIAGTEKITEEQVSLFGKEAFERPLLLETAELMDYAIKALSADKKLFLAVSKSDHVKRLQSAGNVITLENNKAIANESAIIREVIVKLADSYGEINIARNEAAKELANAKDKPDRDQIKQGFLEELREIIPTIIGKGENVIQEGAGGYTTRQGEAAALSTQRIAESQLALFGKPEPEQLTNEKELEGKIRDLKSEAYQAAKALFTPWTEPFKRQYRDETARRSKRIASYEQQIDEIHARVRKEPESHDLFSQGIDKIGESDIQYIYEPVTQKEQMSLFDFKPAERPKEGYLSPTQRVRVATTGNLRWSGTVVSGPGDVASLLASIRKSPQELFFTVATDKDGHILEVHKYYKGGKFGVAVWATDVAGRTLNIEDAQTLYIAHNHPSGEPLQSTEDLSLARDIRTLVSAGDILTHQVVVGRSTYTTDEKGNEGEILRTPPAIRKVALPIKERTRMDALRKPEPSIEHSKEAIDAGQKYGLGDDGFLLLDRKGRPIMFLPIIKGRSMKDTTVDILKATESGNASAAIIFDKIGSTERQQYFKALAQGGLGDITILDVIEKGNSWADAGRLLRTPSKIYDLRSIMAGETRLAKGQRRNGMKAGDLNRRIKPLLTRLARIAGLEVHVVQSKQDVLDVLPKVQRDRLEEKTQGGITFGLHVRYDGKTHVFLVADHAPSIEAAKRVLFKHEVVAHFGARKNFRDEKAFQTFFNRVSWAKRKEIAEWAKDRKYIDLTTQKGRLEAAEEWFAKRIEEDWGKEPAMQRLWNQFVALVKAWARKMGFVIELSDAEIRDVARQVYAAVEDEMGITTGEDMRLATLGEPYPYIQDRRAPWERQAEKLTETGKRALGPITAEKPGKAKGGLWKLDDAEWKNYKKGLTLDGINLAIKEREAQTEQAVLEIIKDNPDIASPDLSRLVDIPEGRLGGAERRLSEKGLIKITESKMSPGGLIPSRFTATIPSPTRPSGEAGQAKTADTLYAQYLAKMKAEGRKPTLTKEDFAKVGGEQPEAAENLLSVITSLQPPGQPRALVSISELRDKVVGGTTAEKIIDRLTSDAKTIAQEYGFPLKAVEEKLSKTSSGGLIYFKEGKIKVRTDMGEEAAYKTLAHELAHFIEKGHNKSFSKIHEEIFDKLVKINKDKEWTKQASFESKIVDMKPEGPMTNAEFDAQLMNLAREGKVALHKHDFPFSLPEEVRNKLLIEEQPGAYHKGKNYYSGVVPTGKAAEEPDIRLAAEPENAKARTYLDKVLKDAKESPVEVTDAIEKPTKENVHAIHFADTLQAFGALGKILKANKRGWRKQRPDTKWWDRIISIPLDHFNKVPSLGRMFNDGIHRTDNYYSIVNDLTTDASGQYNTKKLEKIRKDNPQDFKRVQEYLVSRDRNAIGYKVRAEKNDTFSVYWKDIKKGESFDSESKAWAKARQLEANDLKRKGWSDQAVDAVLAARMISDKGFGLLMQSMRKLITQFKELNMELPEVYVRDEGGKSIKVNLQIALAKMGDMRGYYFPRIRKPGRYMLTAKKADVNPIMEFFDYKAPMSLRQLALEKQGYAVTKDLSPKMPEDVFELVGEVVKMQAVINEALDRTSSEKYTLEDFGLKWTDRMLKPGLRDFVLTGPTPKELTPMFKSLGAKFYSVYAGEPRAWHFSNPGRNFEGRLAKAMAIEKAARAIDDEMKAVFAKALAEQVANIIKARGSRAHMIERQDATGVDVWIGYEEDPGIAYAQYARGLAAGEAKKIMALDMVRHFTGTDISWDEFKADAEDRGEDPDYEKYQKMVDERRIHPSKQLNAFKEGKVYMEDMLRNDEFIDRLMGTLKGIAVLKYLAGRVSAPVVNLTSLLTSVPGAMHGYAKVPFAKMPIHLIRALNAYGRYKMGKP
ncbi:MAG: JAB domain-containing protein, partial [Pseudomonadota bacterium]